MASGATGTYGLPYPLQTDGVDVAADVQSLATAVEIELLLKAPLDSPTFIGNPTAPTPSSSDNDTSIATTAFVKAQSYLTTTTAASTYAPIASPTFTGTATIPTITSNFITVGSQTSANQTSRGSLDFFSGTTRLLSWGAAATDGPIEFWTGQGASNANLRLTVSATAITTTPPIILPAATTSAPSIRIPHGTAPSSPTNGDVWTTTIGMYARINGNTVGPFGTGATYTASAPTAITGALWANSTYNSLSVYTGTRWASMDGTVVLAAKTATYSLVLGDEGSIIRMNGGTTNNITVPTNSAQAFPIGSSIMVIQTSAVQTTISGAGVSFLATPGLKLRTQNSAATLIKVDTDTWAVMGDLAA